MSNSNNINHNFDYNVLITLRGDLPLEERHKDGIDRATKAIDMIQNIKDINEIEDFIYNIEDVIYDIEGIINDKDVLNIMQWCHQNGISIVRTEWNKIQASKQTEQNNHPISYSKANGVSYSFEPSDETNLNYRVCITMYGDLPLNKRNENALTRLSKYPDIIQHGDYTEIYEFFKKDDISITKISMNVFRNIKPPIKSEEKHSTEENPSKILKIPEEKNPVNTSENPEEYTTDCIIM